MHRKNNASPNQTTEDEIYTNKQSNNEPIRMIENSIGMFILSIVHDKKGK